MNNTILTTASIVTAALSGVASAANIAITNLFKKVAFVAFSASFTASTWGAVLTFDDNTANTSVGSSYGTDITVNNAEFITTGSGTTPNIALTWDPSLEFHNNSAWDTLEDVTAGGAGTHVVQLQNGGSPDWTIQFTPDTGFAVVFNSVDVGYGASAVNDIMTVTITRVSDSALLKTVSSSALNGSAGVTLDPSATGAVNESYTMEFTQTSTGFWGAVDDLNFSQEAVPEPTTTALLGLGGLALILRRRKG